MLLNTYIFKRIEKKYFLDEYKKEKLIELIADKMTEDVFGKSTINSLYLDTSDFLIIRNSIDAKNYKEKLRIRSYSTPSAEDNVFFEIKKKLNGVVYKRRVMLPLNKAIEYINGSPPPMQTQIMKEIDFSMHFYKMPKPKMLIAYDREAFFSPAHSNFRVTFDTNIRYRNYDLDLTKGAYGKPILPDDITIMEVKTDGAMPIWMSNVLDKIETYPTSFSKYARAYLDSECYKFLK